MTIGVVVKGVNLPDPAAHVIGIGDTGCIGIGPQRLDSGAAAVSATTTDNAVECCGSELACQLQLLITLWRYANGLEGGQHAAHVGVVERLATYLNGSTIGINHQLRQVSGPFMLSSCMG